NTASGSTRNLSSDDTQEDKSIKASDKLDILSNQTEDRTAECEVWKEYHDCGLLSPELEMSVRNLPPLRYKIEDPEDPGLMLFKDFKNWNVDLESLKRIITSKGTSKCGNPARLDPSGYSVVKAGTSEYIGYKDKPSVFVNVGVVGNSYLTGDGKQLANTDKYMRGISITALAYEFNRQFSFMLMITGDDDDYVRTSYDVGELEFNTRPGVPIFDGTNLDAVVLDGADFNPNVLPRYEGGVSDNMIVMVGYAINRWKSPGNGATHSVDVRLSFNIVYVVVLCEN
ncbi:hypothetical protein PUNSTDRAFT_48118, partial [Punctularia strigosozonata HHB-11173 SS5]